jgi:hypothetical protein
VTLLLAVELVVAVFVLVGLVVAWRQGTPHMPARFEDGAPPETYASDDPGPIDLEHHMLKILGVPPPYIPPPPRPGGTMGMWR